MEQSDNLKQPTRTQGDYSDMTHSVLLNHWKTEVKKSKGKPVLNRITDYLIKRVWSWFYYYITSRFGPNHIYKTYTGANDGIYPMGVEPVTIAVTADWATDTRESTVIAKKMESHDPDYTIHLGDTYFVGAPHEIMDNFIGPGTPWVRGKKGSFAVLGNHEMYARGVAFFDKLLPSLGLKNAQGNYEGQEAGFFCLENKYWRILGLDTGYHSIGKIPIIELIPWFAPDCHFDKLLMDWLYEKLKLDNKDDKRGLLILTHHQYFTAFKKEGEFQVPADQLAKVIGKDRPVLWLWGHEHKLSIFEKAQINDGITAYGRCIGHGGMPIEIKADEFQRNTAGYGASSLVMVDTRQKPNTKDCPLGYNGYVLLSLTDKNLEVSYHDEHSKIFSESWEADLATGKIKGTITPPPGSMLLKTEHGKTWKDAVK